MEGAINFGLAQALKRRLTVSGGRVEQSNFHDYEVLRMNDAPPNIEVHIVDSSEPPGGCGEPGVPRLPRRWQCHFRGDGKTRAAAADPCRRPVLGLKRGSADFSS